MDWNSIALVSLGGLLGVIPSVITAWANEKTQKKSVAAAFAAEISVAIDGPEKRGLLQHFQNFVRQWEQGKDLDQRPGFIGVEKIEQDFPVYHAYIDKVGVVGPDLAGDIVLIYATFISIRHDIMAIQNVGPDQIDWVIQIVKDDLNMWEEASTEGKKLVNRLQALAQ